MLNRNEYQAMHDAYVEMTKIFLRGWINQGATWTQCQQAIEFGDDERDEDVVNPLFPDMGKDTHVADSVNVEDMREDHHQAPEPPEDAPYCDICGGRHEHGYCYDLQ